MMSIHFNRISRLRRLARFAYGSLLLVAAFPSTGLNSFAQTKTPVVNGGGVSGRVLLQEGKPAERVLVSLLSLDQGQVRRSTYTDADGKFTFSGLPPLVFRIHASIAGYIQDPNGPSEITARVGEQVTLNLIKGGVVTGRVTGPNGEPIVAIGVMAQVQSKLADESPRAPTQSIPRLTDDRGVYRLYGLLPGTYRIAAGGNLRRGLLTGNAYETTIPIYHPSSSADDAVDVTVVAGSELSAVDIQFRKLPGHRVSGTIEVSSGGPAGDPDPPAIIHVQNAGVPSSARSSTSRPINGVRTFSIEGLSDGDYDLIAQTFTMPSGDWATSTPKRVSVRGVDLTGLKLITVGRANISGKISIDDDPSKPASCPTNRSGQIPEITIREVRNEKSREVDLFDGIFGRTTAAVNENAQFSLRNLVPGPYRLALGLPSDAWYVKGMNMPRKTGVGSMDLARAPILTVPGEKLVGVLITLGDGAASLEGRLVPAKAKRGAWQIHLVPSDATQADNLLLYYEANSTPDGKVKFVNLAPGKYWMVARPPNEKESSTDIRVASRPIAWDAAERAKLRREAEAAKKELILKVCDRIKDVTID